MAQALLERGTRAYGLNILAQLRLGSLTAAMTGTLVLTTDHPTLLYLDTNGAARNLDLPAEASSDGLVFIVFNNAGAANSITVRNPATATVATVAQGKAAIVFCDGTAWKALVGA